MALRATTIGVAGGSGTPGGSSTQVQYNSGGVFAGATGITTDGTSISIGTSNPLTVSAAGVTGIAANGAASTSPLLLSGTILTGGTGTTDFPALFIQPTGTTAATTLSTSGTAIGVNVPAIGNFLDFRVAGTFIFGVTGSGRVSVGGNGLSLSGNRTTSAWTTSGQGLTQAASTWTDNSSSGTVPAIYINAFKSPTFGFSNATTVTNAYNTYFEDPVAGTNGTLTAKWALGADSAKFTTLAIGNSLNSVSPTSPNRTITMVVGGTTVYIACKTTND